jgi:hypothetical protein
MAFETPSVEEPLDLVSEYKASAAGGLYVARMGEFTAGIIVPPAFRIRSLADLRCVPHVEGRNRSVEAVVRAVRLTTLWGRARLPGDFFSSMRQRVVLQALTQHIFWLFGGDNWAEAEVVFRDGNGGLARLKSAVSKRREEAAIGVILERDYAALSSVACVDRIDRVASLGSKFLSLPSAALPRSLVGSSVIRRNTRTNADDLKWLSELALRLASDPAEVEAWAGENLLAGIGRLLELPTLARVARFLVIATDCQLQSRTSTGELYAGWRWT